MIELPSDQEDEPEQQVEEEDEEQLGGGGEGDEQLDELPEILLTPSQLEERQKAEAERQEQDRRSREDAEARAVTQGLRAFLDQVRQPQAPPEEQVQQPAGPRVLPQLTPEKRREITQAVLQDPEGIAKLYENAIAVGRQLAAEDIRTSPEGVAALQVTAEGFADKFAAKMLKDPSEKLARQIEPYYNGVLAEYDLIELARMSKPERDRWLANAWDIAAGRMNRQKIAAIPQPQPPGVARGSGQRAGAPQRRVRIRMTEAEKKSVRDSLRGYPNGAELAEKQIAQMEAGVTDDPKIAAAVDSSIRFSRAVRAGGA